MVSDYTLENPSPYLDKVMSGEVRSFSDLVFL